MPDTPLFGGRGVSCPCFSSALFAGPLAGAPSSFCRWRSQADGGPGDLRSFHAGPLARTPSAFCRWRSKADWRAGGASASSCRAVGRLALWVLSGKLFRVLKRLAFFVLQLEIEGGLEARGIFDLFITHLVDMAWVQGR